MTSSVIFWRQEARIYNPKINTRFSWDKASEKVYTKSERVGNLLKFLVDNINSHKFRDQDKNL